MIGKASWEEYRDNFAINIRMTAVYVFILACTLQINILAPISIIITIPFFVLPFTFAYISATTSSQLFKGAPVRSFLALYPLYYQGAFFGGFRALIGFAKAILISIICGSIMTIILYYAYLRGQPGFAGVLHEIDVAKTVNEMNLALEHFAEFEPAKIVTDTSTLVGGFFGSWIFLRHCLLNSEKITLNLMNKNPAPMKTLTSLFITTSHLRRKQFLKEYYGAVWYVVLAFVFTFGGGAALAKYVFHIEASRCIFIGLFVSLILMIFFIPYYFIVVKNICVASTDDYQRGMIAMGERALETLKKHNQITEEEIKKFEEDIKQKKEALEKMEKELKEQEEKEKNKQC